MKHCLVVDDSDVIRKVTRRILETMRVDIADAESGPKGLDACQIRMPDAILLDWMMPGMGGLEFISAVRHMPCGKMPVIVYCVTENDPLHISKALQTGANHFLMKPVTRLDIHDKLAEAGVV